ncbi:MAG: serpin family protein [Bacteroidales bacterium]|nr:serpin family protein [Bacteroidales bacterium]
MTLRKISILVLAALAALSSCGKDTPENNDIINPNGSDRFIPLILTKSQQEITSNINGFGYDMFRSISSKDSEQNVFVSPYSASLALSLLWAGAEGNTSDQIGNMLGFGGMEKTEMIGYYSRLSDSFAKADSKTLLEVANALWLDKKIHVKDSFKSTARKDFASDIFTVDFTNDSPRIVKDLNAWCDDKTHGCIPKILDEIDPNTAFLIANALYFKSSWQIKFDKTEKGKFTTISSNKVNVSMMTSEGNRYEYSSDDTFRKLSVPYGNGTFVMDIYLPVKEGAEAFKEAVQKLDKSEIASLDKKSREVEAFLKVPEFKFEYETSLIDTFKSLGMTDAFVPFLCDLSGVCDESTYVSLIKQKTYIDVNIKGTEAAAVTVIGNELATAGPPAKEKIEFIVDRPFIFSIKEVSTGAVLFIGQKLS